MTPCDTILANFYPENDLEFRLWQFLSDAEYGIIFLFFYLLFSSEDHSAVVLRYYRACITNQGYIIERDKMLYFTRKSIY